MSAISPLDDDPTDNSTDEPQGAPSASRLRTLRAATIAKLEQGDTEVAAEMTERFRSEHSAFSLGKTAAEVEAELNARPAE